MENKAGRRICPRCKAAELHRSQMRGLVERTLLRPLGIRAYRCASCDQRFLGIGGSKEKMVRSDQAASVKAE